MRKNTYFADFETNTYKFHTTKTAVNIWGLKGITNKGNDFTCWDVGIETFIDRITKFKNNTIIYFHNLSWDGEFILHHLTSYKDWTIYNDYQKIKTTKIIKMFYQNGKIYEIKLVFNEKKSIIIRCSFVLLLTSVSGLGQILNKHKKPGIKWYDYWCYEKNNETSRWIKHRRLKNYPGEKFEIFRSKKEFIEKNKKFHKENKDCECYLCYMLTDIDIVYLYFKKFTENKEIKISLTASSTSLKTFASYVRKSGDKLSQIRLFGKMDKNSEDYKRPINNKESELFLLSYCGGHTDYNTKFFNDKNRDLKIDGYSYDVNSLYPSVMGNNSIAVGGIYENKPTYGKSVMLLVIDIKSIKLKKGYPSIFQKKLIFNNIDNIEKEVLGENPRKIYDIVFKKPVKVVIWKREFDFYKICYDMNYKIYKIFYVLTSDIFNKYIKKIGEKKKSAKIEAERTIWKAQMNLLYGKFGQKISRDFTLFIDVRNKINWDKMAKDKNFNITINNTTLKKVEKLLSLAKTDKYHSFVRTRKDFKFIDKQKFILRVNIFKEMKKIGYTGATKSFGTASYITMLARCVLYKAILNNRDNWLYCDTDSLYIIGKPKNLSIHGNELGFWKPEHRFNRIKVIESKKYLLKNTHVWKNGEWIKNEYNHFVCSGIKKTDEPPEFELFEKGLTHDQFQNQKKLVNGGWILVPVLKKY